MITVYRQVNPLKKVRGKPETRCVGEIDARDGAPRKFYGVTPRQLAALLKSNIHAMGIESYNFSSDPKDGHARLRDSIAPNTKVERMPAPEAETIQKIIRS